MKTRGRLSSYVVDPVAGQQLKWVCSSVLGPVFRQVQELQEKSLSLVEMPLT